MPDLVTSARFSSYRLIEKLGDGGMAEVFRAEVADPAVRHVALKLLKRSLATRLSDLFAIEADLMGLLRHPNLVELYEVGSHAGRVFLAMELVDGADLRRLMDACRDRGRPFPPGVALRILVDVLTGLAYFHQATSATGRPLDLVHGDVNPSNIFLSRSGVAKLGDFGAARVGLVAPDLPGGVVAGKLHYLSPEQVGGRPLSAHSDLFSVGVVFEELMLGARPFEGTEEQVLDAIRHGRRKLPDVSAEFGAIAKKALARDAKDRYATAGAFAGDLLRYQLDAGLFPSAADLGEFIVDVLGPAVSAGGSG